MKYKILSEETVKNLIEFLDDEFNTNTELGRDLKRIYEFKKVSKDLCSSKTPLRKNMSKNETATLLSKQNREINDLYNLLDFFINFFDLNYLFLSFKVLFLIIYRRLLFIIFRGKNDYSRLYSSR